MVSHRSSGANRAGSSSSAVSHHRGSRTSSARSGVATGTSDSGHVAFNRPARHHNLLVEGNIVQDPGEKKALINRFFGTYLPEDVNYRVLDALEYQDRNNTFEFPFALCVTESRTAEVVAIQDLERLSRDPRKDVKYLRGWVKGHRKEDIGFLNSACLVNGSYLGGNFTTSCDFVHDGADDLITMNISISDDTNNSVRVDSFEKYSNLGQLDDAARASWELESNEKAENVLIGNYIVDLSDEEMQLLDRRAIKNRMPAGRSQRGGVRVESSSSHTRHRRHQLVPPGFDLVISGNPPINSADYNRKIPGQIFAHEGHPVDSQAEIGCLISAVIYEHTHVNGEVDTTVRNFQYSNRREFPAVLYASTDNTGNLQLRCWAKGHRFNDDQGLNASCITNTSTGPGDTQIQCDVLRHRELDKVWAVDFKQIDPQRGVVRTDSFEKCYNLSDPRVPANEMEGWEVDPSEAMSFAAGVYTRN